MIIWLKNIIFGILFGVLSLTSSASSVKQMEVIPETLFQDKHITLVRNAVLRAGASLKWIVVRETAGTIDLQYNVSKSVAVMVRVYYRHGSYRIAYVNSVGLNYEESVMGDLIDERYNKWLKMLDAKISDRLGIRK